MTPAIEPHPDAPLLITDTFLWRAKVAVYDAELNALVPAGWVSLHDYDGWTLHKFDWNSRIGSDE